MIRMYRVALTGLMLGAFTVPALAQGEAPTAAPTAATSTAPGAVPGTAPGTVPGATPVVTPGPTVQPPAAPAQPSVTPTPTPAGQGAVAGTTPQGGAMASPKPHKTAHHHKATHHKAAEAAEGGKTVKTAPGTPDGGTAVPAETTPHG